MRTSRFVTVSSSPEVIWAYAEAMDLEDRREIDSNPFSVGSRTDSFFDQSFLRARKGCGPEGSRDHRQKRLLLATLRRSRGKVSKGQRP